jgi:hypothetical protein
MKHSLKQSRVAQWKRAGPITQRSVDRNYALLATLENCSQLYCLNLTSYNGAATQRWILHSETVRHIPVYYLTDHVA